MVVDCPRATVVSSYDEPSSHVVSRGHLRVVFLSNFKIAAWHYVTIQHNEFVSRRFLTRFPPNGVPPTVLNECGVTPALFHFLFVGIFLFVCLTMKIAEAVCGMKDHFRGQGPLHPSSGSSNGVQGNIMLMQLPTQAQTSAPTQISTQVVPLPQQMPYGHYGMPMMSMAQASPMSSSQSLPGQGQHGTQQPQNGPNGDCRSDNVLMFQMGTCDKCNFKEGKRRILCRAQECSKVSDSRCFLTWSRLKAEETTPEEVSEQRDGFPCW